MILAVAVFAVTCAGCSKQAVAPAASVAGATPIAATPVLPEAVPVATGSQGLADAGKVVLPGEGQWRGTSLPVATGASLRLYFGATPLV